MAEVLGPVETLRAAAARLRETAKDASVPPWYADGQEGIYAYGAPGEGCPTVFRDRRVRHQDVLWIALVHPGVAEPLADWLEHTASAIDLLSAAAHHHAPDLTGSQSRALRVARVLLGVPDATP